MSVVTIDLYFDDRYVSKKDGTCPFKLYVYSGGEPEYYPTIFRLSPHDKAKLIAPRLGEELQRIKTKLQEIEDGARAVAKDLVPFNYEEFEKDFILENPLFDQSKIKPRAISPKLPDFDFTPFFKKFPLLLENPVPGTIGEVYQLMVKKKLIRGKIGTAASYQTSYVSLVKYGGNVKFPVITDDYLFMYGDWMKTLGNSKSSTGIYLRALRSVFNEADALGIIKKAKCYPFGKRKYKIPSARKRKNALDLEDVERIYYYECNPLKPWLQKAKDYWLFLYFCNGQNANDLCLLKFKNIIGEFIEFERVKTEDTMKNDPPKIKAYLKDVMLEIIDRQGNKDKSPENYIFPVFQPGMTALRQYEEKMLIIKFINKWMRVILADLGIKKDSTSNVARHTFATVRKRAGGTTEEIQEDLGHENKATTENYLGDFELDKKKKAAGQLDAFARKKNKRVAA
jgi:integrase/recombinase XerD